MSIIIKIMVGMFPRARAIKYNLAMSGGLQLRYSFPFIGKINVTRFLAYVTRIHMINQNKIRYLVIQISVQLSIFYQTEVRQDIQPQIL